MKALLVELEEVKQRNKNLAEENANLKNQFFITESQKQPQKTCNERSQQTPKINSKVKNFFDVLKNCPQKHLTINKNKSVAQPQDVRYKYNNDNVQPLKQPFNQPKKSTNFISQDFRCQNNMELNTHFITNGRTFKNDVKVAFNTKYPNGYHFPATEVWE